MGGLADSLRDNLKMYIEIAPYTTSDPFDEKADHDYFVLLDSKEPKRMVSMFVAKKDPVSQIPWNNILNERLLKLPISKEDAAKIKAALEAAGADRPWPAQRAAPSGESPRPADLPRSAVAPALRAPAGHRETFRPVAKKPPRLP